MSPLTEHRDLIRAFQNEMLVSLTKESFADLAARPPSTRIPLPGPLSRFEGYIRRKPGDSGGVEITVQVANRVLWLFMEGRAKGFEIFPDGKSCPSIPRLVMKTEQWSVA
jgi:hypothetical protein